MKIGIISWKQGGGTNDYVLPDSKKSWLKPLKIVQKGEYQGKIPFEKALIAYLEHKYKDVKIMYLNQFDEKKLKQNDINFCVSLNLLYAWEKGNKEYQRVLKIMKNPKINIYPNLKEQNFLFNKGDYLQYYENKGIPIAPTFVIKGDRNIKRLISKVEDRKWKSFVLKPHNAYANIGIGKFDVDDLNVKEQVSKYLQKHKKFPGFVCQEVMDGFAKFWEVKSFWINGKFKYYIAMKASGEVFSESKIYSDIDNPRDFGRISPSLLKDLKKMGKKIVQYFPKDLNQYSNPPLYLRIDFGCCAGNKLDGKKYFLNEIEYAGCAIFSEESGMKKFTEMWGDAYYKKAKEFLPIKTTKKTKRKKRSKKRNKKTKRK